MVENNTTKCVLIDAKINGLLGWRCIVGENAQKNVVNYCSYKGLTRRAGISILLRNTVNYYSYKGLTLSAIIAVLANAFRELLFL